MNIGHRVLCLIIELSLVYIDSAEDIQQIENSISDDPFQGKKPDGFLVDIEIVKIYLTSRNSVKIFWGITPEDIKLNRTYGLFYDIDNKEDLIEPKTATQDPCIEVLNLEFCKRYFFAVAPLDNGTGINPNSTNIRSILTYMDPSAPPLDLHVSFLPGYSPCLLIKWTASCRNMPGPQGYKIRVVENHPGLTQSASSLETSPSTAFQQACNIPIQYGTVVEVSVANDRPDALFGKPAKFKVPQFMQPFDVRLAVNESSKAFLLYWREPYVPICEGRFFYEVFVYEDRNVTENSIYTVFRTNRPGFVFKGNGSEYTFGVDVACCDFSRRSAMSDLVYGNVEGKIEHIVQF